MWDDSYHIRNVVRVHLIQILIIDVRIGKVKPVEQWLPKLLSAKLYEQQFDQCRKCMGAHPSTRSPMLSRWPRNVRQWYCWLVSISDVFWTHTSARVCWNTQNSKLAAWIQQRTAKDSCSEMELITEIHTRLDLMPAPAPSFWSLMMSMSITINSSSCRGLHRLLNGLRQYVFASTSATGERWRVVSAASFQQRQTHK